MARSTAARRRTTAGVRHPATSRHANDRLHAGAGAVSRGALRQVEGATLGEALEAVFASRPALRGYVLDDQGALRRHVAVYVNGRAAKDRARLGDPVGPGDEIYVFQALTGG
jgi:molybdopterin synthase sulfur carrier subunit